MLTKFTKSKKFKQEYSCKIVQVGNIKDIKGSDFLGLTIVNGYNIVVRKDQVKEGDIMFYVSNECQLNSDFISCLNLYRDSTLNKNNEKKGYFEKNCRVKMIKLKGQYSMGILFSIDDMKEWIPKSDFELKIGEEFDTINDELFVKAYVPEFFIKVKSKEEKRNKKLGLYDRIIPGEFNFHYDTLQLNSHICEIDPFTNVFITNKLHGTSSIIGNILTKVPKWKGLYSKIFSYLPKWLQFIKEEYDVIYASRTVIKNRAINNKVTTGYYNLDVWAEYYNLLKDKLEQGFTIYGEICGYIKDSNKFIQKGYDYGCEPGENFLMIYRVAYNKDGIKKEYEISEVYKFTLDLIQKYPELEGKIHPISILYYGRLCDLYPELSLTEHWHENVLENLKNDKRFLMEENEPMCRNIVPREGIVLRIEGDSTKEAFKLKCRKFLYREGTDLDNGEIDIEMLETNY